MRLCSVVVEIDVVSLRYNFTIVVVATCTTNVVRALQFATVVALSRVACNECIV
jgi:hypothetical protein